MRNVLASVLIAVAFTVIAAISPSPANAGAIHYALWNCEHQHEAGNWYDRDSGHNGHYGGLQMHYNWGYGIRGYAYNYTPREQIIAAERGFRASGYSITWLLGQWYHPDCLRYA